MNAGYRSHLDRAAADPGVRVIVVTGAGRGFCAGAESDDLAGHAERGGYHAGAPDGLASPGYGVRPEFDAELAYHFGVGKPIIAAVNGPAAGFGFALACYCDLRIAARSARFTTAQGRLGLPVAFGLAWLLPRLVGAATSLDLLLSSRVVDAEEAGRMGLANRVVDDDALSAEVRAYAGTLATAVSPASMAVGKRQIYESFHQSAAESVGTAESLLTPMMQGPDYAEGVAALRAKHPARYADPPPVNPASLPWGRASP